MRRRAGEGPTSPLEGEVGERSEAGEGVYSAPMPEPFLRDHARDLRKQSTDAEARLWRELRGRRFSGFKFRRQQPLGDFIADFCCLERKLTIELDGGQHAEDLERAHDEERTTALAEMGFRELRFWNTDVFQKLTGVLETIEKALKE